MCRLMRFPPPPAPNGTDEGAWSFLVKAGDGACGAELPPSPAAAGDAPASSKDSTSVTTPGKTSASALEVTHGPEPHHTREGKADSELPVGKH